MGKILFLIFFSKFFNFNLIYAIILILLNFFSYKVNMFTKMIEQNDNFQTQIDGNHNLVKNLNYNLNMNQTEKGILINENKDFEIKYPNDFNKNEVVIYFTFKPYIKVFCYASIVILIYLLMLYIAFISKYDITNSIIYLLILLLYITIFIIFIRIIYQIKITFNISHKFILFEEIGFCKVKSERKNLNEVVSIRIKKLFHENILNLEVINLDGLSIPLDTKCSQNCSCCQNIDIGIYSSKFDNFIFICNSILEKCQKITNTFPCIDQRLRINDFYYEKATNELN